MTSVKDVSLEADRVEDPCSTTPSHRFFFRHAQHAAPHPPVAELAGQEYELDKHEAERGSADHPAESSPVGWIARQHVQRPGIPISHLLDGMARNAIVNDPARLIVGDIRQE